MISYGSMLSRSSTRFSGIEARIEWSELTKLQEGSIHGKFELRNGGDTIVDSW